MKCQSPHHHSCGKQVFQVIVHILKTLPKAAWVSLPTHFTGRATIEKELIIKREKGKKKKKPTFCLKCRLTLVGSSFPSEESHLTKEVSLLVHFLRSESNYTCAAHFSLIKPFLGREKLPGAYPALLCGLKNFNGLESHYDHTFPGLVNKLHILIK